MKRLQHVCKGVCTETELVVYRKPYVSEGSCLFSDQAHTLLAITSKLGYDHLVVFCSTDAFEDFSVKNN